MYFFYRDGYPDAHYADAVLDELKWRDRTDCDLAFEPFWLPTILIWLVIVGVALGAIVGAILALS